MKQITARLTGEAALIMQADTLADPLDPLTKELKKVSKKKDKTDADFEAMMPIEMRGSIYFDAKIGVYLPASNLMKCLIEGARLGKKGKTVERGVLIVDDKLPLIYDGPKDLEALIADKRFLYRKTVVVSRRRTVRCRPIFREWGCLALIAYEEAEINGDDIVQILEKAGRFIGLGNRRPQFGRFSVECG